MTRVLTEKFKTPNKEGIFKGKLSAIGSLLGFEAEIEKLKEKEAAKNAAMVTANSSATGAPLNTLGFTSSSAIDEAGLTGETKDKAMEIMTDTNSFLSAEKELKGALEKFEIPTPIVTPLEVVPGLIADENN